MNEGILPYWRLGRELESGEAKRALTAWWLGLIEQRVLEYLASRGYDHHALPDDYIDTQPRSLAALRTNLSILRSVVAQSADARSDLRRELVDPLRQTIYSRIDAFSEAATLFLRRERNIVQLGFSHVRPELRAIAGDLEYLAEMRRKEDIVLTPASSPMPATAASSPVVAVDPTPDVVPVNGLIIGALRRLENEHYTALSHWQSRTPQPH